MAEEKKDVVYVQKEVDNKEKPMTVGAWFLTLIILAIPAVNIIFSILWFFGVGNRNRVTFIRALALPAIILIILFVVYGASILSFLSGLIK